MEAGEPWAWVLVTLIGSVPATIAALGAWRHSREAKVQATAANHAVNNRPADAPTIAEQVDRIAAGVHRIDGKVQMLSDDVRDQREDLARLSVEVGQQGRKLDGLAG